MANAPFLYVRDWAYHGTSTTTHPYTDLSSYIAYNGLKWSRNDIDASDAGRDTQDGLMHRARVAIKIRLDVTCRPLEESEATTVLQAILPEWLDIQYFDPQSGAIRGGVNNPVKFYSNNIPATFLIRQGTTNRWTGIAFPLIEQ